MNAGKLIRAAAGRKRLCDCLFDKQQEVDACEDRLIATLTPRRAGKTLLICVMLLDRASKTKDGQYLYVGLTRPSAKRIAWRILKQLNRDYHLGAHFLESELAVQLPSGAQLWLLGADQENWIDRIYGSYYNDVAVDEAGSFAINLRKVIYDVLKPCCADKRGRIYMTGTPQDATNTFFYEVTRPELARREPGWRVFTWSTLDNPFMREQWEEEMRELHKQNPRIEHTPGFRRHYLGQWVKQREGNVYLFDELTNVVTRTPDLGGFKFILGLDFGWDDAQAFVVGAWSPRDPCWYALEAYKEKGMTLDRAAARIRDYQAKYPGLTIIGDPARKQLLMELVERFRLPVGLAPKEEKHAWIELANTDMVLGKIKAVQGPCEQLIDEITDLKKFYKNPDGSGDWEEHPKQANDCCDCMLYAWRWARHWQYQEQPKGPQAGTPAAADAEAQRMLEDEMEKARMKKEKRSWWRR